MEIPAASPLSPLDLAGGGSSAAQRQSGQDVARAGEESNQRDVLNLFERARQALMSQQQLAPAIADVLATVPSPTMPPTAPEATAPVAVQLAMDDSTQRVVVRLIDTRTGAVLREMPSTALAVVAARVGRGVPGSAAKVSMR